MRGTFAVFLNGVLLLVLGAALFDWRAGVVVLGLLLAVGALFWDGDQ